GLSLINNIRIKSIALTTSIINLVVSLIMFILFDFSSKQFQFIEEHYQISYFDIYLGVDGLSIYFIVRRLTGVEPAQLRVTTGSTLCKPTDSPEVETWRGQ